MKAIKVTGNAVIIEFDETKEKLIEEGWLGDEDIARVFTEVPGIDEVRIFKKDGQSYVISEYSNDFMSKRKALMLKRIADDARSEQNRLHSKQNDI